MSFKNRYGIGNNVWKFQVSTMKIVPVARIWSLGVTRIITSQRHGKGKKVKSSMARSLPVENLLPQNVGSIINYLQ